MKNPGNSIRGTVGFKFRYFITVIAFEFNDKSLYPKNNFER